ncbi:MAG TPA: efflux RND transporter permease subunit, partial [Polyangia bacterium]
LHVRAPIGTRIEDTEIVVSHVEDAIRRIIPADELQTINDNIGLPTYYNLAFVQTDNVGGQDAEILIQLRTKHHPTLEYAARMRRELGEKFPDVQMYFMPADVVTQVLNFGTSSMIDVQVEGNDLPSSFALARQLYDRIRTVPGIEDVRVQQVTNHPALKVEVDRQQAAQIQLTIRDVANSLITALSSSLLTSPNYWVNPKNGVAYPVVVQTPIVQVASVAELLRTALTPSTAQVILNQGAPPPSPTPIPLPVSNLAQTTASAPYLGGVAQLLPMQDRASVNHYSVQPVFDVQASVSGRDLGGASSDIGKIIAQLDVPKTTHIRVRGQSQSMRTAFTSFGLGLIVAIVLVYFLLVILFQSLLDPLIIVVAIPGAFVGIAWMLALTGTTLNVESFMGSIMAVGIAVSNSILLVSFANEARAENEQLTAIDAALQAGRTRLRPVLMTALAMILGMLPMALALGEGGEQNAPLGRAVIGGLMMATLVTLLIVPTFYTVVRTKPPTAHELDKRFASEARGAISEGGPA